MVALERRGTALEFTFSLLAGRVLRRAAPWKTCPANSDRDEGHGGNECGCSTSASGTADSHQAAGSLLALIHRHSGLCPGNRVLASSPALAALTSLITHTLYTNTTVKPIPRPLRRKPRPTFKPRPLTCLLRLPSLHWNGSRPPTSRLTTWKFNVKCIA